MLFQTPFSRWLVDCMDEYDMSVNDVSDITGLSPRAIYSHMNATCIPTLNSIKKYAKCFHADFFKVYELTI